MYGELLGGNTDPPANKSATILYCPSIYAVTILPESPGTLTFSLGTRYV